MANTHSDSIQPITLRGFARELSFQFVLLTLGLLVLPLCLWLLSPLVLGTGLLIAISLCLMQRLVGLFNFRQLTIPGFFFLLYLAIILVPGLVIFDEEVTLSRNRFLVGVESVLLTVPLGIWVANLCLDFRRQETLNYFQRSVVPDRAGPSAQRTYVILMGMALALVLINLWETPVVPLWYLLRNPGDFLTAAMLREDAFKLLNSKFTYAYYVLRGTILPFLIMVAFGRYRTYPQSVWKKLFLVSFCLGVFYAAITIEKSPVATILGMLGLFYYLFKGGRLGKTATVAFPALFILFPLIVILLAYHGSEGGTLWGALQALADRLFYSPAQVVYAYFEVFPNVVPFQHGGSLLKLAHLLGWRTVDIPNVVGVYMTEGQDIDTITANSCFIGNFYADFGLVGVAFGGVLAGFCMQFVNIYLSRKPKTVVNLAAYAICFWAFGMLVASALSTQLLSGGVAFAILLVWLFKQRDAVPASARS